MEDLVKFWRGKKVLITGMTGFKGSWLAEVLLRYGAEVFGYSLDDQPSDALSKLTSQSSRMRSVIDDVTDVIAVQRAVSQIKPEIVFHMAAQPLVGEGYQRPLNTFQTNACGTLNILDVCRNESSVKCVLVITTDKVYENRGLRDHFFVETDNLGAKDPYSASKVAAELISMSYLVNYYRPATKGLATARSGNVIGGGDWSADRIVPDYFRAWSSGQSLKIRNGCGIRPWQHVLDTTFGYLSLAKSLYQNPIEFSGEWNFAPPVNENQINVNQLIELIDSVVNSDLSKKIISTEKNYKEQSVLRLDASKVLKQIGFKNKLSQKYAIQWAAGWYLNYLKGANPLRLIEEQIEQYEQINR